MAKDSASVTYFESGNTEVEFRGIRDHAVEILSPRLFLAIGEGWERGCSCLFHSDSPAHICFPSPVRVIVLARMGHNRSRSRRDCKKATTLANLRIQRQTLIFKCWCHECILIWYDLDERTRVQINYNLWNKVLQMISGQFFSGSQILCERSVFSQRYQRIVISMRWFGKPPSCFPQTADSKFVASESSSARTIGRIE